MSEKNTFEELKSRIRELEKAEDIMREQKDFLNTLLETISNPIFYKDEKGHYTGCNKAFETFIGKSRSEIIGKTVYELARSEIADKYNEKDLELMNTPGSSQRYEWKVEISDGSVRDVIFDKAILKDTNGTVTGLVGVISDITQRKHTENLVRNLSQMLMAAQERERQMISCELHDTIAQNLSTLKLYCTTLFSNSALKSREFKETINTILRVMDQTITSVRNLACDLRPPALNDLGLVHALEAYCKEFAQKNRIVVDFQTAGIHGLTFNSDIQINLYRLVQEALNNIRKHSKATEAVIRLVGAYPNILLHIEDNGKGFDLNDVASSMDNQKHMGLRSMKERINLIQGKFSIQSQINVGTRIDIKLPIKDQNNKNDTKKTYNNH